MVHADRWQVRSTDPALAARYRDAGWWTDDSLGQLLERDLARHAQLQFRVWSSTRPYDSTVGSVLVGARRFATGLIERGIEAGDVVAFQLPNCAEAAVVFWGAAMAGAVLVPIVHFYGPKELGYILEVTDPKL